MAPSRQRLALTAGMACLVLAVLPVMTGIAVDEPEYEFVSLVQGEFRLRRSARAAADPPPRALATDTAEPALAAAPGGAEVELDARLLAAAREVAAPTQSPQADSSPLPAAGAAAAPTKPAEARAHGDRLAVLFEAPQAGPEKGGAAPPSGPTTPSEGVVAMSYRFWEQPHEALLQAGQRLWEQRREVAMNANTVILGAALVTLPLAAVILAVLFVQGAQAQALAQPPGLRPLKPGSPIMSTACPSDKSSRSSAASDENYQQDVEDRVWDSWHGKGSMDTKSASLAAMALPEGRTSKEGANWTNARGQTLQTLRSTGY